MIKVRTSDAKLSLDQFRQIANSAVSAGVIDPFLDLFSQLVFELPPQLVLGFPPQLALDLLEEFFFAFVAGIVEPLLGGFRHRHGRASFQLRSRASSNPTVIVTNQPANCGPNSACRRRLVPVVPSQRARWPRPLQGKPDIEPISPNDPNLT